MERPFVHQPAVGQSVAMTPEELYDRYYDGQINDGDRIVDRRTGTQFPAYSLHKTYILSGVRSRDLPELAHQES